MRVVTKRGITFSIIGVTLLLSVVEFFSISRAADILHSRYASVGCNCTTGSSVGVSEWFTLGIAGLFGLGFLIAVVYFLISFVRTHRLMKILRQGEQVTLDEVSYHVLSGERCGAFTLGLLRPKIAVCQHCHDTLAYSEVGAMLRHEAYHVRRRDPLRFFILEALKRMYFFVPVFRPLFLAYRTASEIEADASVVDRDSLGRALLQVTSGGQLFNEGAAFASSIEERIERLIDPQWKMKLTIPRSFLLFSGITLGLMILFISRSPALDQNIHARTCGSTILPSCAKMPTYGDAVFTPAHF